jgi:hypothetical protein
VKWFRSATSWARNGAVLRRSSSTTWRGPPGARPNPRSIRPGCSAASVPNCSATTSGGWFGSNTPPAPTRSLRVAFARWPTSTAGALLATPRMPWCSGTQ